MDEKIRKFTAGKVIGKMWKDMDKDETVAFRAEVASLDATALKDSLAVQFSENLIQQGTTASGFKVDYLPLSVYEKRGYDTMWLKRIEDSCDNRGDGGEYICSEGFGMSAMDIAVIAFR